MKKICAKALVVDGIWMSANGMCQRELDPDQFRRWWPADASASKSHLTIVSNE